MSSVRFICGTQELHKTVEKKVADFLGMDDSILFAACFDANCGVFEPFLDKECATEKGRKQRRQGIKPEKYILINEELCEGCGDCYRQSEGCAALYAVDTEFGEKTQVRQANCAQDELCVDGECPSFVQVKTAAGRGLRRRTTRP